jgi:hypothetical protein
MKDRKAFSFYRSYYDIISCLDNDSDKLQFLLALLEKQFNDVEPLGLSKMAMFAFNGQRHSIDSQVNGYKFKMCKTGVLTEGDAKGVTEGDAKGLGNKSKSKSKSKSKGKSKENEKLDIHTDFLLVFEKWMNYKKDRKESYKSTQSQKMFYNKMLALSNNSPEIAMQIIEQSMANNWAGIFELKQNQIKQTLKLHTEGGNQW